MKRMQVINPTAALREQMEKAAELDQITCLRRGFGRQVRETGPSRLNRSG